MGKYDNIRMQVSLDAAQRVVNFRDFMLDAKIERSEFRIDIGNTMEDSVIIGVFMDEFVRQGFEIEHVTTCPIQVAKTQEGQLLVFREISLFVKKKEAMLRLASG